MKPESFLPFEEKLEVFVLLNEKYFVCFGSILPLRWVECGYLVFLLNILLQQHNNYRLAPFDLKVFLHLASVSDFGLRQPTLILW